jgi:hypothetical protein
MADQVRTGNIKRLHRRQHDRREPIRGWIRYALLRLAVTRQLNRIDRAILRKRAHDQRPVVEISAETVDQ